MLTDLVLEGGGVKGIALVGALSVIEERGYTVNRVAGTSAGAIVGSLVAAGMKAADLKRAMQGLDYRKFRDESLLDRVPILGKGLSVLLEQGIYEGNYARRWVDDHLAACDVHTFADLQYVDKQRPVPDGQGYRLVVMASDLSQGCLRRLPWDYHHYGCKADEQSVADAVRASMSIPFFYEPVKLRQREAGVDCFLVDGGMLSNFPVDVFDAPPGTEPRWPTFGIKLSAKAEALEPVPYDVHDTLSMTTAMLQTLMSFYDRLHIDDPGVQARTIFIDTSAVRATDFDIGPEQAQQLFDNGRRAADLFFDGGRGRSPWHWETYKHTFRTTGGEDDDSTARAARRERPRAADAGRARGVPPRKLAADGARARTADSR